MNRITSSFRSFFCASLFAIAAAATPVAAQQPEPAPAAQKNVDFITPHITDSHSLDVPGSWRHNLTREVELPRFKPIQVGGMEVDLSITKHVVFMLIAALLTMITLIGAARSSVAGHSMRGRPHGLGAAIEALALNLRNEVILPNVGDHGEKFVPFALTLFFFILFCNLLGLFPYGSTPTGNISVTATLAIITFLVVEITGILTLGVGYLSTIIYWNKDLPIIIRIPMMILMSPIELLGKITKPIALTLRLFANMTAGHIVLLAIIGLIFTFGSWLIAGGPFIMATAISMLELFVAFLQAFIFTLLASVFIGQMRVSHH